MHLSDFPMSDLNSIDSSLERQMEIAQDISSMVLGLRKKVNIKVRQPLRKIMVLSAKSCFSRTLGKSRGLNSKRDKC